MLNSPTADSAPATNQPNGFQAVVLAVQPVTDATVCGLSLAERGRRLATRAGAEQVWVVEDARAAAKLPELLDPALDLLLLRVRDQVVHFPLIDVIRPDEGAPNRDIAVAIDPGNNHYAGAIWIPAAKVVDAADVLSIDPVEGDRTLAERWLADGDATAKPHGDIARHAAATKQDRAGATKMLFRLVHKPQDSPLSRVVNRRVSYPFTRMFLPTPVTPNMLSVVVLLFGLAGCVFVALGEYWYAVLGTSLVLFAGYLDGCDGEIARLRHEGSNFGAWLDTIVDELTTVCFLIACGVHVYVNHPSQWLVATIVVGAVSALVTIYVIYYYLIVVAKSNNSQDYPTSSGGFLDYIRMMIKRDFINLGAVILTVAGLMDLVYTLICLGALVTALIMIPQHISLRISLRNPESELSADSSGTFTKL